MSPGSQDLMMEHPGNEQVRRDFLPDSLPFSTPTATTVAVVHAVVRDAAPPPPGGPNHLPLSRHAAEGRPRTKRRREGGAWREKVLRSFMVPQRSISGEFAVPCLFFGT